MTKQNETIKCFVCNKEIPVNHCCTHAQIDGKLVSCHAACSGELMKEKYWIFKVLSGLPKAETKFYDFEEMKLFSASLSDMYPDVVSDYE